MTDVHRCVEESSTERMHVMSRSCWCSPIVDLEVGGAVVTHHALTALNALDVEKCLDPFGWMQGVNGQPDTPPHAWCARTRGHSGNHAAVVDGFIVEWDGLGWAVGRQPVPQ